MMDDNVIHCFVMPKINGGYGGFTEFYTKKEKDMMTYISEHHMSIHTLHKNRDYLLISVPEHLVKEVVMRYKEYTLRRDL